MRVRAGLAAVRGLSLLDVPGKKSTSKFGLFTEDGMKRMMTDEQTAIGNRRAKNRPIDVIPQVDDCDRYLYACPRGTIAIDEYRDGTREVTRTLGAAATTKRDLREAIRMHEQIIADAEEEARDQDWDWQD